MEDESSSSTTRPAIAFPVGLGLLLLMLLCMSAFFLCCLHWNKIRALLKFSSAPLNAEFGLTNSPDQKPAPSATMAKQEQRQSIPVLMPGDDVPKFIAMACPCEPPLMENKITIVVQKPSH